MRAENPERDALNDLMRSAHADALLGGSVSTRAAAERYVDGLADLERFGHPWVAAKMRALMVAGAMTACRDWRRKHLLAARTRKGASVPMPMFVGVKRDGSAEQAPFAGLSLDDLRKHQAKLAAQRDTLSRELQVVNDLIALMESGEYATAGDALAALMERAA